MPDHECQIGTTKCLTLGIVEERVNGLEAMIKNRLNLMIWIIGIGVTFNLLCGTYLAGSATTNEKAVAVATEKVYALNQRVERTEELLEQYQKYFMQHSVVGGVKN